MRVLLSGLQDYRDGLSSHVKMIGQAFQTLEGRWHALSAVYEGTGADEFKTHWHNTIASFNDYINRAQQITAVLQERIGALEDADRAGGL